MLFQTCLIGVRDGWRDRYGLYTPVYADLVSGDPQGDEEQNASGVERPDITPCCLTRRERNSAEILGGRVLSDTPSIRAQFFFQRQPLKKDRLCLIL